MYETEEWHIWLYGAGVYDAEPTLVTMGYSRGCRHTSTERDYFANSVEFVTSHRGRRGAAAEEEQRFNITRKRNSDT